MKKIYLGLSGGIDSAVCGYLIKKDYPKTKLVGIHGQFSDSPLLKEKRESDLRLAETIANKLKIDLEVVDLAEQFRNKIIYNYLKEYRSGRTPNPCVVCNREIKFGILKERYLKKDGDRLAMGHYVRLKDDRIYRGIDQTRDQSYFLWSLESEQLNNLIFPLGEKTKEEVRKIAEKIGLNLDYRAESSGACFFPRGGHQQFMKNNLPELARPGQAVNKTGKVIGTHYGVGFYTIGQRYGLQIDPNLAGFRGKDIPPLYVIGIEPKANQIILGKESELYFNRFKISNTNWSVVNPLNKDNLEVQIRHLGKRSKVILKRKQKSFLVTTREDFRSIAPGQSAVFYEGDLQVGGGIIDRLIFER